jgi:hypothetical protein
VKKGYFINIEKLILITPLLLRILSLSPTHGSRYQWEELGGYTSEMDSPSHLKVTIPRWWFNNDTGIESVYGSNNLYIFRHEPQAQNIYGQRLWQKRYVFIKPYSPRQKPVLPLEYSVTWSDEYISCIQLINGLIK